MTENEYPGCRPGWKPDMVAAEREGAPQWSVEDQIKSEQAHWKLRQEAAAAEPAPEDPPASEEDDESEEDDDQS